MIQAQRSSILVQCSTVGTYYFQSYAAGIRDNLIDGAVRYTQVNNNIHKIKYQIISN
jgi:hypothetical protein